VSTPSSRTARQKHETHLRIRAAAARLFGERGVEATKVADICEEADIARQTFFNHFPTKADVLTELFEVGLDLNWAVMQSVCERAPTTRERLRLYLEEITEATIAAGPMHRDLSAQVIRAGRSSSTREEQDRLHEIFRSLVDRGLELGDVTRRHDPAVLAQLLEGAVTTLIGDWISGDDFEVESRARQLADAVADALEKRSDES